MTITLKLGHEKSSKNEVLTERNMKIEDLNWDSSEINTWDNIRYNTQSSKQNTVDQRLPRWEESDPKIYGTIKNLISEKVKIEEDTIKIKKNSEILPKDKLKMLKSARNLSWTINTLLEKSKDRLSEYYDSQVRDKSVSPERQSRFGFKSFRSKENNSKVDNFTMCKFAKLKI